MPGANPLPGLGFGQGADEAPQEIAVVFAGRLFAAETAATGVDPGSSVDASAPIALYNPKTSGMLCIIRRASLGYVSGTLSGSIHYCLNDNRDAAPVSGTVITPVNLLAGGPLTPTARAFTSATLPVVPKLLEPMAFGAFTAGNKQIIIAVDHVDGRIVLQPGTALSLQGNLAISISPVLIFGMVWQEVPTA